MFRVQASFSDMRTRRGALLRPPVVFFPYHSQATRRDIPERALLRRSL